RQMCCRRAFRLKQSNHCVDLCLSEDGIWQELPVQAAHLTGLLFLLWDVLSDIEAPALEDVQFPHIAAEARHSVDEFRWELEVIAACSEGPPSKVAHYPNV